MLHRFLTLLFFFVPFFSPGQDEGLVARFYFNKGDTRNELGPAARGVGVTFGEDRFGNRRSACQLHGNNASYLSLGTSPVLKPRAGTISIWVNLITETFAGKGYEKNPILLTKSHAGDDFYEAYSITYDLASNRMSACSSVADAQQAGVYSTYSVPLDKWCHYVITYDDHSFCFYVNGELDNCSRKDFPTTFLDGDSVLIGQTANPKNERFSAICVDDIRIYDRVLTPQEIAALYNEPDPNRFRAVLRWVMISVLVIGVITLIVLLFTRKYKKALAEEREKNRMQSQLYEMERKVIKAQMNPHFIFNSMNSIQQLILINNTEHASAYLVKFSRLLRKILESNTEEFISVAQEADVLDKYLEIESLRFDGAFSYTIRTGEHLADATIKIPQLLIQPIVENAVWHGLLPKTGEKKLSVTLDRTDKKTLTCTVEDNGIGRNASISSGTFPGKKSFGIQFIRQRLELMRKEGGDYGIDIIDKVDDAGKPAGARVVIRLPLIQEEPPC